MHMVRAHLCFYYPYLLPITQRPQYFSYLSPFLSIEYLSTILWCKLNTILNHTEVYHFTTGKLILHLRYDFESSDNCDTIGKILRYYRVHRGYSTHELAEMVGVVPATIILYENDKHPIKYKTAVLFAEVLGIDRKLLFDEYTAFVDYPCDVLLREARERLSLNQSQMAQEIGVARSAYSAWERATRTPRRQEYEKIAPLIKKS